MSKVVGDHLLCVADEIVFQHDYQGTTYVVACRIADGSIVDYLTLTGANATTVILSALGDLTAGRTWKELVAVMGSYVDLGVISVSDYTDLQIIGKWVCQANLGQSWIVNSDQGAGNTEIEIHGGHVDANKVNQNADMSCIYFVLCTYCWVHHVKVAGGNRVTAARGEGVELRECSYCYVLDCEVYSSDYDNIKLSSSEDCIVANNICRNDDTANGQLQIAHGGNNIVADNNCYSTGQTDKGITIAHGGCHDNIVMGNGFYGAYNFGIFINSVTGGTEHNIITDNHVENCSRGIHSQGASGEFSEHVFITGNYIKACGSGIRLEYMQYSWIAYNFLVDGTARGIRIENTCTSIRFGPHYIYNQGGGIVTDNGVNTEWPSVTMQFALYGDGATIETDGILVDAANEWGLAQIFMPWEAHTIVKLEISGRSVVAEGDGMLLELRTNAGADNEPSNTHTETVTVISTTLNFAANDIIRWLRSSDVITAIKGGDSLSVRCVHAAAVAPDCATNVDLRNLTVYYI